MPALPRLAGRARRRADYISPGLAGLVFPEPRLPEPGDPGNERRPSPHRPSARKVTSGGIPSSGTWRNSHTPFLSSQLLPVPRARKNFPTPLPPFSHFLPGGKEEPFPPFYIFLFFAKTHRTLPGPRVQEKDGDCQTLGCWGPPSGSLWKC